MRATRNQLLLVLGITLSLPAIMGDACMGSLPSESMTDPREPRTEITREEAHRQVPTEVWYQLSPDDSTSMASAQLLKLTERHLDFFKLFPHEVVNYYDPPASLREAGDLARSWETEQGLFVGLDATRISAQDAEGTEQLDLLVHVYAPLPPQEQRRPWTLHLCVDVSGSMQGDNIALVRDALLRLTEALRPGDQISLVTFSSAGRVVFPTLDWALNERAIRDQLAALEADGSTNMIAGLELAYAEAQAAYAPAVVNRVLLFSDGMANVGDTDVDSFAALTRINNQEGIYLSGVGVGMYYDASRMDALTDAGKGAHVFLPSAREVGVIFGGMVRKLVEVAADEVAIEVTLPSSFELVAFSGEEVSSDPNQRVPNVVLAAGDDMTVLASFTTAHPEAFERELGLTLRYRPLGSGEPQVLEQRLRIADLVKQPGALMARTSLVDRYARWACDDDSELDAGALARELASFQPLDAGLVEVVQQLARLRQEREAEVP